MTSSPDPATLKLRRARRHQFLPTFGRHPEGALAKLCGACPIPASSGKVTRHRLNGGGNRQANAALHRVVVVRMRSHPPTIEYVRRRTAEGKPEIIRCLKRFVTREIFGHLCRPPKSAAADRNAA